MSSYYNKFFDNSSSSVQDSFHDYSRYIKLITDDKKLNAHIAKHFYPIDFSNIPGFPNFYHAHNDI